MDTKEHYVLCLLARGTDRQFKWINKQNITKDFKVQVKPEGVYWVVEDTFDVISKEEYKEKYKNK